jgi:hypothetical protein
VAVFCKNDNEHSDPGKDSNFLEGLRSYERPCSFNYLLGCSLLSRSANQSIVVVVLLLLLLRLFFSKILSFC